MIAPQTRHDKDKAADLRAALLRRYFLNRTDKLAFRPPWNPNGACPIEGGDNLDAALLAHVQGDAAPAVTVRWVTEKGKSGEQTGRFRLGGYSPDPAGRVAAAVVDCDGGGRHKKPLKDPLRVALRLLKALKQVGIVAHLECSGSGTGWHVWILFSAPVAAAKVRRLLLSLAPKDALLQNDALADAATNKGIEVFPKQDAITENEIGNQVWLPWWSGAADGGNLFYEVGADDSVAPYEPDDFETAAEDDLDRALAALPEEQPRKRTKARTTFSYEGDAKNDRDKELSDLGALDASCNYDDWLRVGMSLHSLDCSSAMLNIWDNWSRSCPEKYKDGECAKKWAGFDGNGKIKLGTLLHLAKQNGWVHPRRQKARAATARNGYANSDGRDDADREAKLRADILGRAHANGDGKPDGSASPDGDARADRRAEKHKTDKGNARRVIERHGGDLRYCQPWKSWLIWSGPRWAEDNTGEALRRVKETQDSLYEWAVEKINELGEPAEGEEEDPERKAQMAALKGILGHVLKREDWRRTTASLSHAQSEPGVPILPEHLNTDPMLLNVQNGTLDLRTGRMREHRRVDLITKLAPVAYDPAAQCPLWMKFLRRIMGDKDHLVRYLQRVAGYCLTGDVREQVLWFLHGGGSNGKSTFLRVLLDLMGDYGYQAVSELLMEKKNASHPTERADLFGRRLVCTIETDEGKRMAEALMKQLTGGDRMTARKLFRDFFEFDPTHKILLAANHKPTIRGTDLGNWRRIKLVPFTVTISDAEKDKTLPEKLRKELPGILTWAVAGCMEWRREGLEEPDEVRQATENYRAEQDVLAGFIETCCVIRSYARVKASALLESYTQWSGDKYMTPKLFSVALEAHGYEGRREAKGVFYHGLDLLGSDTN